MSDEATFYTIADARFFPGLAALLNSLRLSGNPEGLVVLDVGLTADQVARLEPHARVVKLPTAREAKATLLKAFPRHFDPKGVIVIIDSDMVVARPLDDIVARAARGELCFFPDHVSQRHRWFAEWQDVLSLSAPLRRGQTYVNGGFAALSVDHWPEFLERWARACARVPAEQIFTRTSQPFWAGDQDALNAILMSEVDPEGITVLPADEEAYPDALLETEIVDARTLECRYRGVRTAILHSSLAPKPWEWRAWPRLRNDAYVRLLPRLLLDDDVAVRLRAEELPLWLRPNGRPLLRVLDNVHGAARAAVHALPPVARERLLAVRNTLYRRLGA